MTRFSYRVLSVVLTFAAAAQAEPAKKVTFEDDVVPIFRTHCAGCHNQEKARADLNVMSYQAVTAGGAGGEVLSPGDASASKLYLVMTHAAEPKMPPKSGKVPDKELDVIKRWIDGGLLEKSGSQAKVSKKPKMDLSIAAGAPVGKPATPIVACPDLIMEPEVRSPLPPALTAVASNPWAPIVAVAGVRQVLLYSSDSLELLGVLPFPEGIPHVLRFSRSGQLLLAGGGHDGKAGRVVVWQVSTGKRVSEVGEETDAVLAADISADQSQIALGGPGKLVKIYSTKTGELIHSIKKHTDWVTALEFSPDGVLLASGDRNGGLCVWEAFSGREFYILPSAKAAVSGVSWRADANVLASVSEDGSVRLFEMFNGTQAAAWNSHGAILSVAFTHDGRIATSGRDRLTRIFDGAGKELRAFEATPDLALRVVFSHDGARVITGDWSGVIRVWNAADGKLVGNLTANPPTLAERIDEATKQIAAVEPTVKPLTDAQAAAQAVLTKEQTELPVVQKQAADASAALKATETALAAQKTAADQSKAQLKAAQDALAAKEKAAKEAEALTAKAVAASDAATAAAKAAEQTSAAKQAAAKKLTDVAKELEALAKQSPADKSLAEASTGAQAAGLKASESAVEAAKVAALAVANAKTLADALPKLRADSAKAAGELPAAQKGVGDLQVAVEAADKQFAATTAEAAKIKVAVDATTKAAAAKAEAVKTATAAAAAAKAALDKANADLAAAKAGKAKWQVASAKTKVIKSTDELAAKQAKSDELTAAVQGGEPAIAKAAADFAAAKKLIAEGPAQIQAKEAEVVRLKQMLDQSTAAAAESKNVVAEREGLAKPIVDQLAKLKAVADKNPSNKTLLDAFAAAKQSVDLLAGDLEAAKKIAAGQAEMQKQLAAKHPATVAELAALKTNVDKATKGLAALEVATKDTVAKLAADKAALAALAKELAAAKASLDEHSKALAMLSPPPAK